jgi:hypothetical protein
MTCKADLRGFWGLEHQEVVGLMVSEILLDSVKAIHTAHHTGVSNNIQKGERQG